MSELSSFFGIATDAINESLFRRDAYKMYKQELDSLYALSKPRPKRAVKL